MELRSFLDKSAVRLDLQATSQDDVLRELIELLNVDARTSSILFKCLKRRENFGSTGIGRGVAIPHCRSLAVSRLRVAYGRRQHGIEFRALDGRPVSSFFLIVAPPNESPSDYLPVLGRLVSLVRRPDVPERLAALRRPDELFELLSEPME
jgi:mannitol/fructose-specific phosphotransferase system IIA component (Ntr-type)